MNSRRLFELLLPSLCPACDEPLALDSVVHPHCWQQLHFISRPYCDCCGMPLIAEQHNLRCAACFENPPPWDKARSALLFKESGRRLVLRFKYGDHIENAALFAGWMMNAAYDILDKAPLLVPIPLHWQRLLRRRYNQAAELVRALSHRTQLPFCSDFLIRSVATKRQSRLHLSARIANMNNVFTINEQRRHHLASSSFLLVDDVFTSGATMRSACKIIRSAVPHAKIFALTLAIVASE